MIPLKPCVSPGKPSQLHGRLSLVFTTTYRNKNLEKKQSITNFTRSLSYQLINISAFNFCRSVLNLNPSYVDLTSTSFQMFSFCLSKSKHGLQTPVSAVSPVELVPVTHILTVRWRFRTQSQLSQ